MIVIKDELESNFQPTPKVAKAPETPEDENLLLKDKFNNNTITYCFVTLIVYPDIYF